MPYQALDEVEGGKGGLKKEGRGEGRVLAVYLQVVSIIFTALTTSVGFIC
jgi:hypothetical protein